MTDYSYTQTHTKEQWAWEFLRRNPEYQRDYTQFIHRWKTLEKVYGKDEERDVQNWQKDIRAMANEWDNEMTLLETNPYGDLHNSMPDPIPIETWMSRKWGLECFPVDPELYLKEDIGHITWAHQEIDLDDIRFDAQTTDPIVQVNFDLRYSLADQLEAAHKDLMTLTTQLQRLGKVKLVAADHYDEWLSNIQQLDDVTNFEQSSAAAQNTLTEMYKTGYRKILLMRG